MTYGYIEGVVNNLYNSFETINPYQLAGNLGIEIAHYPFSDNINGIFTCDTRKGKNIIGLNSSLPGIRERFILSHELGHAFLHPDLSRFHIEKNTLFVPDKFEKEANQFAAALLIDNEKLYKLLERSEPVKRIAYEMKVPDKLVELKLES